MVDVSNTSEVVQHVFVFSTKLYLALRSMIHEDKLRLVRDLKCPIVIDQLAHTDNMFCKCQGIVDIRQLNCLSELVRQYGCALTLCSNLITISDSVISRCSVRRVVHAAQCSDTDGPRMPPDFVAGQSISTWPSAYLGREYNKRLDRSNSTRIGGRYYAQGCLHQRIPENCLVIDVKDDPNVDIVVDVAPIGSCKKKKKSVVMDTQCCR
jgi:hypothetical protein